MPTPTTPDGSPAPPSRTSPRPRPQTYRVALARILPRIGAKPVDELDAAAITDLVAELSMLKRESIRKTLSVLAQVVDHARVQPNPVRDPLVELPRGERKEVNPPTAEHIVAVHALMPARYKLPLLVLDASGMRIGELEALTWGDVDEPHGRWRVSAGVSKSGTARWVAATVRAVRGSHRARRARGSHP